MRKLQLLMVEDDEGRVVQLREWLPADMRIVWARSAGAALGVLKRDGGSTYAGVLLDHDLQQSVRTQADVGMDGRDIVDAMVALLSPDVLVAVHSMNPQRAPQMVAKLDTAGFSVQRTPFADMTRATFQAWCSEVRENADGEDT